MGQADKNAIIHEKDREIEAKDNYILLFSGLLQILFGTTQESVSFLRPFHFHTVVLVAGMVVTLVGIIGLIRPDLTSKRLFKRHGS